MCLDVISKEERTTKVLTLYKVAVEVSKDPAYYRNPYSCIGFYPYPIGKTIQDQEHIFLYADSSIATKDNKYKSGYHCYSDVQDALRSRDWMQQHRAIQSTYVILTVTVPIGTDVVYGEEFMRFGTWDQYLSDVPTEVVVTPCMHVVGLYEEERQDV